MLKRNWERVYNAVQRRVQKMEFFPADAAHAVPLAYEGPADTYELPDSPLLSRDPSLPDRGILPPALAYRYKNMTGLGDAGLVRTSDGRYIHHPDVRFLPADSRKVKARFSWILDPNRRVSPLATYVGHSLPYNYFHFLTDFMAPYLFYRRYKEDVQVVFGFPINDWQKDILNHFGIGDYLSSERGGNFHFDDLVILPRANFKRSKLEDFRIFRKSFFRVLVEEAFERLAGKRSHDLKRIYIRRPGNYRCLENERELVEKLTLMGFVSIDSSELSFEEKLRTFRSAEIVVAPLGAGTTNMIFTPPGAALIDVMPSDYASGAFLMMGLPGDHRYAHVIGSPLSAQAESFGVSINEVLHQIDVFLAEPSPRPAQILRK